MANPDFLSATYLGGSTLDPISAARNMRKERYVKEQYRQAQQEKNTEKGLKDMMVDAKGWEDQQGFKEILADQNRLSNAYLSLSQKGLNLASPKTDQEIRAFKALNDAHEQLKQKVDTWNQQKGVYDAYMKAIDVDAAKPIDDQKIDREATLKNIQNVLNSKSILERGNSLQNLVVTKPDFGDIIKYVNDQKDFFEQPKENTYTVEDPDTGEKKVKTSLELTPEQEKTNIKKLGVMYDGLDEKYKNTIKKMKSSDQDQSMKVLSDKDYFISQFSPTYKEKFTSKPVSRGGGFTMSFGGTKDAKIDPGKRQTNDQWFGTRNYNDRYEFASNNHFIVNTKDAEQNDQPVGEGDNDTDGWSPVTGNSDVEADILFYDPPTDRLFFRSTANNDNPWVKKNTVFSVPRGNVSNSDKLPIILPSGKRGTLKDILPKEDGKVVGRNTVLRKSGIVWK